MAGADVHRSFPVETRSRHDSGSTRPPVLDALTGIRAFAALWVLALHGFPVLEVVLPAAAIAILGPLAAAGFLGVDMFFVLSGFIISYNYAARFDAALTVRAWGRFLWARLARIYPVHLVILVALAVVVFGFKLGPDEIGERRLSVVGLIGSLLLVHAWVDQWDVWNPVSWSISAEWLAYLCFPVLSAVALAVVRRVPAPAAWVALAATATLPALRDTIGLDMSYVRLPLQVLSGFLAGCLTYRMFEQRRGVGALCGYPGAVLLLLIALAAICIQAGISARWTIVLVPFLLLGLARGSGGAVALLSRPQAVYWGKVSFSLYMTHYLWLWVAQTFVPRAYVAALDLPEQIAVLLLYLLPPLPIAAATYHLIEVPARLKLQQPRRTESIPQGSGMPVALL